MQPSSSSGVVKKGICSKLQGLLGDLRVTGPGGSRIKLRRLQAAPGPVGARAHALLFSDLKMRGSKKQGTRGGPTSSFQLASCGIRITLRHMHTETHRSSRQGLALYVNERRDDINNPPKVPIKTIWVVFTTQPGGFLFLTSSCLSCLSLSCPPLPSTPPLLTPSSWCPLNTADCFLLQLITDGTGILEHTVEMDIKMWLKDWQEVG